MDDERTRRIAANEAIFRTLNEELEGLNEAFAFASRTFLIVCECGDLTCVEQIEISVQEYAKLRSDPTLFAIVRGHAAADTEGEIASRDGWDIVRKRKGLPTVLARETFR